MIAPEPGEGINKQTSSAVLLRNTLLIVALIFALLEVWRPYFFLTDDNLDGDFPFFVEMGQNLLSGQSPFVSHHLFGSGYNFLRDPAGFKWHPLYLLVSLLAGTPFRNAIIDVNAFVLFMLSATGFIVLAIHLRREKIVTLSNGWITFYAVSYTYTMIALTTGASWLTFLGNQSALPWLVLGVLQKKWTRGIALVAIFVVHQSLGGHLAPTVSNSIFLSVFALGMTMSRRSLQPLGIWLSGYAIALLVISPLLIPMLGGFFASMRSQGVSLEDMQANNIPMSEFPISLLVGMALWLGHPTIHPYATYTLALASSAAVWCLIPALISPSASFGIRIFKGTMRHVLGPAKLEEVLNKTYRMANQHLKGVRFDHVKWSGLEVVTLFTALFGALLICRPLFISELMTHLPLFRSMRWPFRELIQFQFFMHLFLLVRKPGMTEQLRRASAVFGTFVFIVPLLLYSLPPTFNAMNWDRELILTGGVEKYWAQVRPLLKPDDRIAVLIPLNLYEDDRFEEPYTLLGTYNYAVLAGVVNAWGYSPTVPRDQTYTRTYARYPFGAYFVEQKAALMEEKPELKFITLESLRPLKITLSSRDGPTIDLTPFVPTRISKDPGPPPAEQK